MTTTSTLPQTPTAKASRTRSTLQPDGSITVHHARGPARQDGTAADAGSPTASVGEVMTPNVLCVSPDVEIESLMALLIERGISGVPVVNERGLPVGIVSKTDIVRHLYEDGASEPAEGTTAGELMIPLAFTLLESAPVSHAAALMAWEGVHRIPICSDDGDVVGILSSLDLVRYFSRSLGYPVRKSGTVSAPLVSEPEGGAH